MSDILEEALSVKNFLSALGLSTKTAEPDERSASTLKQKAETLARAILKDSGFKYDKKGQKKREDGHSFQFVLKKDKKEYLIKCFVIFATGHFSMTLWSEDGQDLLQVITIGFVPKYMRAMEVIGKQRIEAFMAEQK